MVHVQVGRPVRMDVRAVSLRARLCGPALSARRDPLSRRAATCLRFPRALLPTAEVVLPAAGFDRDRRLNRYALEGTGECERHGERRLALPGQLAGRAAGGGLREEPHVPRRLLGVLGRRSDHMDPVFARGVARLTRAGWKVWG